MFDSLFHRRNHTTQAMPAQQDQPHVVVIGGGFAGANAVLELADAPVRVTLIDRNVFKTFQPLLYQVATAGLNPGDVTMFLRGLTAKAPNMRFRQGLVLGLDPQRKIVRVDDGGDSPTEISYDHLILANGLTTNYFGTEGAEEHSMPMYTRHDATAIRDRIFAELERTSRAGDFDPLHISVVGGGASGVEIAGALADFRRDGLGLLYPEMDQAVLQVRIIQRGKEILKAFPAELRTYAAKELQDRGVTLELGHGVTRVGYDHVELDDGSIRESDITIWAAGVTTDSAVPEWGLPLRESGRIAVDDTLQVEGLPGVYAAGDIAGQAEELEQLAQPAIQTGRHAAAMIRAELAGEQRRPFHYKNLGSAATIGRRAAIMVMPGGQALTGTSGWLAWLGVHIMKLMGGRNQRAVAINLMSLYAGFGKHRHPNPATGDVDSLAAARTFGDSADRRKFGPGHAG
ncbi:NAD(P)/FAD-dependent oxidoreductase [Kocuria sp. JC486]|uniref:NAD(P)/FAD-dependent oxidoreductase n=1 Tax=Kocuria sp. JC486 TaxID=1970736 RepID=UPI0032AFC4D9